MYARGESYGASSGFGPGTIIQLLRGSWLNYQSKVCKKCFYVQPSIFKRQFLIQPYTVSSLFENHHWIIKVPLACNLMGYLLAIIKTSGNESNLPSNDFWPKLHYMGGVNAFAIFMFSAQFKSGTDQSSKPKTPKLISKSLFAPFV